MPTAEISNRICLDVTGEDSFSFLQGLITNDLKLLESQEALYACFLTPQGKFLHDFLITEIPNGYRLEVLKETSETLIKHFKMYKLRSRVGLEINKDISIYASWGKDTLEGGYTDPRLEALGKRYLSQESIDATAEFNDYDRHRISLAVPDGSRDLTEKLSSLYDGNIDLLNGVSFDKGCYLGQELTARMHYRGLIKKRLLPIETERNITPDDQDVCLEGRPIGRIYSYAGSMALACVKVKDIHSQVLELHDKTPVRIKKPDWLTI